MKPPKLYCKKYCDLYDGCTRTECNRKPILYNNAPIKMEELSVWNKVRNPEKIRAYKEVPLSKGELLTKY